MNQSLKTGLLLILLVAWSAGVKAENPLEAHLLVDLVGRNTSAKDHVNTTMFGNSNFHALRMRLFLDKKVSDNFEVFSQLLSDNARSPRISGAYVRFKSQNRWLNAEAGMIRNPFGTWGPRTYSDKNSLIGVPLGYNYHTAVTESPLQTDVGQLLANRGLGNVPNNSGFVFGLPFVYDACWNTGILFFGGNGTIEYMASALSGSLTYPTIERRRGLPQFSGRFGYSPFLGLNLGSSFAYGPYLTRDHQSKLPAGADLNKYCQRLLGWDLSFERGKLVAFGEGMINRWTHPYLPEPLDAYTWYVEGTYKFATQFYFAARYDWMEFSKINDPSGGRSVWDYPLYRIETGLGYRFDRNVTIKLVGQLTRFPGQPQFNDDIVATQISTSF
ncbi:MAG TPA: hypothetical protein VNL73_08945 [Verrucomicrobiae bacterium]|nr:hypothetical protein [Verrucomicrobiae bacterium]